MEEAQTKEIVEERKKFLSKIFGEGFFRKDKVKSDLATRAEDRVNATIVEKLPPEKLADFEKLLDDGNETQLRNFCQENIHIMKL